MEEIADLRAVLEALINAYDLDLIQKIQDQKRAIQGGFERRFYIEYLEVDSGSESERRCRNDSEKYPEIL